MATTTYHPFRVSLFDGQKQKLQKAYASKQSVTIQLKAGNVGKTMNSFSPIHKSIDLRKNAASGKGTNLTLSKTQIKKTAQRGGNIFNLPLALSALPDCVLEWSRF